MNEIGSSRAEARQLGLKFYYGKSCCRGHEGIRYTNLRVCVECSKFYYERDKEASRARNRAWRQRNLSKEQERERQWCKNNKFKASARSAKRRAGIASATLPRHEAELLKIYETCPKGYHVDHIIPLKGRLVCGLHVPWNLQHLPAVDNMKKGNQFS